MKKIPEIDIDIYSRESLANPYANYRLLRDVAPVVYLPKYGLYAFARFDVVRDALNNWQVFSSAKGVAMNDVMNEAIAGGTLGSDEPVHAFLRNIVGRPLTPPQLAALRQRITEQAEALVKELCAKRRFDAATELAQHLPLSIVSDLVGLPDEGREQMLTWAAANFNSLGPRGLELTETALPILAEMVDYAKRCTSDRVKKGSWAAALYEASNNGEITFSQVGALMNDYLGPSLDTTIFATSNAISLFAKFPEQWHKLRKNPALIPVAINEAVRLESPIQGFSRYVTRDFDVKGYTLPAGSRVLVLFASANRDERRWENPEIFDIERRNSDHLGFGHGIHQCLGANLARLEISALLSALIKRVARFEVHDHALVQNLILRGFEHLTVTAHPFPVATEVS
jgi:cytochrome P450